jgi:hypothetical protein
MAAAVDLQLLCYMCKSVSTVDEPQCIDFRYSGSYVANLGEAVRDIVIRAARPRHAGDHTIATVTA